MASQVDDILVNPECVAGKHGNCDRRAFDLQTDEIVPDKCPCPCHNSKTIIGKDGVEWPIPTL